MKVGSKISYSAVVVASLALGAAAVAVKVCHFVSTHVDPKFEQHILNKML